VSELARPVHNVEKPRVLFLCSRNSAQSQMAEALLRSQADERFEACSAGLEPAAVHPFTRQVLEEIGIDTAPLQPKSVGRFLGKVGVRYAIIVDRPDNPRSPRVYPFASRTLRWPVEDPGAQDGPPDAQLAAFRRVRDQLSDRIRQFLRQGE
jgi:arsenate reductase (thioredoxin)